MGLANLITSSSAAALALIKQYVGIPYIAGVPVQATRFRRLAQADVAQHMLIDLSNGKQFVNDNIAPGPFKWHIDGYLGTLPIELTSLFMPSIKMFRNKLDKAFLSRELIDFLDPDFKRWKVVIEAFDYEKEPDTQNRLTVRFVLSQVNILTASVAPGTLPDDPSSPGPGTADGTAASAGNAEAQRMPYDSIIIKTIDPDTKIPSAAFLRR